MIVLKNLALQILCQNFWALNITVSFGLLAVTFLSLAVTFLSLPVTCKQLDIKTIRPSFFPHFSGYFLSPHVPNGDHFLKPPSNPNAHFSNHFSHYLSLPLTISLKIPQTISLYFSFSLYLPRNHCFSLKVQAVETSFRLLICGHLW